MAMTIRELIDALELIEDQHTEVVTTCTKYHEQATEQFANRVALVKLSGGRTVLAIDQYKHADNYNLEK